jgi:DNA modification methylase
MDYKEFLKTKEFKVESHGFKINESQINDKLYDFQKAIVRWAVAKGKACIFADCGLGKSFMQLEWGRIVGGKCLILAPLAVSKQTVGEGKKLGIKVNLCESQDDVKDGINITNYEKLHKFDASIFNSVILDESSILKSFNGRYRNLIIESFKKTKYKLACTATPSPNDYMELGNHNEFLGVMSRTEMLSTFFLHDMENTSQWRLKKHAASEFWKWVCSWAIYLRNPEELGYDGKKFVLPELRIHKHILRLDKPTEGFLIAMEASSLSERRDARKSSISERVEEAKKYVNGSQSLIWCNLNDEGDTLERELGGSVQVSGDDTDTHKESTMIGFANGEVKTLISKVKICGFGMNYQSCHNMIFVGLSDSFEQYYQAVRRCWRFGQKHPVDVHIILSESETAILKNIERKQEDYNRMAEEMSKNTKDILAGELHQTKRMTESYKTDTQKGDGWTLHLGDCVETIKNIQDESIGMSVFSPPFASLYTYSNSSRDMGNCKKNEEFDNHFSFLVKELYRVLIPGRIVAFHCMNLPVSKEKDGYIGIRDFRGDLIRIFIKEGFIFHSEVCIWKDPVIAMQRTKALGLLHKQIKKDSCMSRMGLPDYVIAMRKPGDNPIRVTHTDEDFPVNLWQKFASPIWDDIDPGDTLQHRSAREHDDERHICPLQLEVIRRCLFMWSKRGDTILSPFAGIGSEGFEAIKNSRKFIGIELKGSYYNQAVANLKIAEREQSGELLFK